MQKENVLEKAYNNNRSNNIRKINTFEIIWTILSFLILLVLIFKFVVFQQVTVVGKSMFPNYDENQLLLVNQIDKKYQRGSVVAVYSDKEVAKNANYFTRFSARFFLKRIIALPNESIEIIGSKVIIYNQEYPEGVVLVEDYITKESINSEEARKFYFKKTKLSENQYFVMGDNRSNSLDSRSPTLGPIEEYAIFGQESIRFWPLETMVVFDLPNYKYQSLSIDLIQKRIDFSQFYKEN